MEDEIVKRKRALLGDRADESCEELSDHPVSDEWLLIECDSLDCNATTDVDLVAADPARDEPLLAAGSRTLRVATSARHTRPDFRFGGAPASGPHKTIRTCSGRLPPWSQKVLMAQPVGKVEEADVLIPQRAAADTARLLGAMEDLAKRGRSRGIGLTVVTQRPQEVSKSVLELMETVILLRMTGPRSIKAAQDWIRVNAADDDTQASEVIATLPSLETGEAWVWSPAFLRLLTRTRIALFETFDSHATPEPGRARIIPKSRADIDLEKLSAEIAATAQRAKDNDPAALRRTVESLSLELDAARADQQLLAGKVSDYEQQLATKDDTIAELADRIDDLLARPPELPPGMTETLHSAAELINTALTALDSPAAAGPPRAQPPLAAMRARPRHVTPPRSSDVPTPAAPAPAVAVTATGSPTEDVLRFRAGAVRMLESLGRMAPLRLTNAQWGTVAKMKHTSGTWSTYLRELRRAGLLDETPDGTTLSDAGFAYLGGRPAPMTGRELQQHYLKILRAGAGRMLQALINAYPHGLTREEISEQAQIAATSGTFSTYLRELLRNGLVTDRGGVLVAGDILMHGADAGKEGASA